MLRQVWTAVLLTLAVVGSLVAANAQDSKHLGAAGKNNAVKVTQPYVTLTGADSRVKERGYYRIMSEDEWAEVWRRHKGAKESKDYDTFHNPLGMPVVDFGQCMVIAVFQGQVANAGGLRPVEVLEEKDRLRFRFVGFPGNKPVNVYGFFLLPRSTKIVVIEEDLRPIRYNQGPEWKERATFPAIDQRRSLGVEEAQEQIRCGHSTLYSYGLRGVNNYNPALGLPTQAIASCIVDESILRRAREHNEYIENWIRQGNTPPNSLLRYNRLIADPFSEIPASSFVPLTPGKPVYLDHLEVSYTINSDAFGGRIAFKSGSVNWSDTVDYGDARTLGVALVADGRIVAITNIAGDKEALGNQFIELFDRPTGISLNHVAKKGDKKATRQRPF
jgi:hypothetical protein